MSSNTTSNNGTSNFNPYKIYSPVNMGLMFSFLSPFIIIVLFTFLGFYFRWGGILFLITILFSLGIRVGLYKSLLKSLISDKDSMCNLINFSNIGTGDIYMSLWVFSFTLFYMITPLIGRNGVAKSFYMFLFLFLILFIIDIVVKSMKKCYSFNTTKVANIFSNICFGGIIGLLMSLAYASNDKMVKHLFFVSTSSSESCKKVNETKFQCSFDFE